MFNTVAKLREALSRPLPGLDAQLRMAPSPRLNWDPLKFPEGAHDGAALLLVYPHDDSVTVALTVRGSGLRNHTGQVSLPGGRVDAGETIERTALRELHEELGVLASTDDILGTLDDYPTRSGYLIAPVVVWSPGITVTPNPAEVAAAYRIACRELFRDGSPEIVAIEESDRPIIRLPLPVANVNAPTAAVLYQFREVALAGRDTRVDHFEQPVFAWR